MAPSIPVGLAVPGEAVRAAGVVPACGAARFYRLEVLFGRRWDRGGAGPCRLQLAEAAAVLFPGRRFRVVAAD